MGTSTVPRSQQRLIDGLNTHISAASRSEEEPQRSAGERRCCSLRAAPVLQALGHRASGTRGWVTGIFQKMHKPTQVKTKCFLLAHFVPASAPVYLPQHFSAQWGVERGRGDALVTHCGGR